MVNEITTEVTNQKAKLLVEKLIENTHAGKIKWYKSENTFFIEKNGKRIYLVHQF